MFQGGGAVFASATASIGIGASAAASTASSPSTMRSRRFAGRSVSVWRSPDGQRISRRSTVRAAPRPISCSAGFAPKLPPVPTVRWIVRRAPASSKVSASRAPNAARFERVPTSRSLTQLRSNPGLR